MMAWQQLHLQCPKEQVDLAESLLMEAEASSVLLEDAGYQPLFEPLPGESPLWDNVVLTATFQADSSRNFEALAHEIASQTRASRVWFTQMADKDWEREWMQYYQPIQCADNLWIVPEWLSPPDAAAINIIMDPGLAFGTGYHATTRLCLDWLAKQDLNNKVVLDYGCGSGVLAIAALLLGAKQAYAVDIDPQAILATQQNAYRNQVNERLQSFLPEEFAHFCQQNHNVPIAVITANILAQPLIDLAPYFAQILKADGKIVLAGLIESQSRSVHDAYSPFFMLDCEYAFTDSDDHHWKRLSGTRLRQ